MVDKAHVEILRIMEDDREMFQAKIDEFHRLGGNMCDAIVENEDKIKELENELIASIGETQELRDELKALKAWTEESLGKIHQRLGEIKK